MVRGEFVTADPDTPGVVYQAFRDAQPPVKTLVGSLSNRVQAFSTLRRIGARTPHRRLPGPRRTGIYNPPEIIKPTSFEVGFRSHRRSG